MTVPLELGLFIPNFIRKLSFPQVNDWIPIYG